MDGTMGMCPWGAEQKRGGEELKRALTVIGDT